MCRLPHTESAGNAEWACRLQRADGGEGLTALWPPAGPSRAGRHGTSRHPVKTTQARPGPTARRLPAKAALPATRPRCVPHSVAPALTGSLRLCGLSGHEPGGSRRASQAAHTADPAREGTQVDCAGTVRIVLEQTSTLSRWMWLAIIRRPSGPSACLL